MSTESKRSKCLAEVNRIEYKSLPTLVNSGRYIRSLRYLQSVSPNEQDKLKQEYLINKLLTKHIVLLQEAIINSNGVQNTPAVVSLPVANMIKSLAQSPFSVSDGKFSLVDVEGLKRLQIIKRAVILPTTLVLPCKVKSENQQYKFNTQIIMSSSNVLAYTRGVEHDDTLANVNHNTLLTKVGTGITNNPLIKKDKNRVA